MFGFALRADVEILVSFYMISCLAFWTPYSMPLHICWISIQFSTPRLISSKNYSANVFTSCFWDAKQLKTSFNMTLRLFSINPGITEIKFMKIFNAFVATFTFGSPICLLKTSINFVFKRCWPAYYGKFK